MNEALGWGAVIVGGYLLYEYFYGSTSTATTGTTTKLAEVGGRPIDTVTSSGMPVRVSTPLTDAQIATEQQRQQVSGHLRGLGAIANRGALLYGLNATAMQVLNGRPRPNTSYANRGETIMSKR